MTDEYGQETSLTREIKSSNDGPSRADSDTSWRRRGPPAAPQRGGGNPGGARALDPRNKPPTPPGPARSQQPYKTREVRGGSGFGDLPKAPAAAAPTKESSAEDAAANESGSKIPSRTIDLYWQSYPQEVIWVRKNKREAATREVKSRMPVVLRNLAPDTAFDPRDMWAKEKKRAEEAKEAALAAEAEAKAVSKKGGSKKPAKKTKKEEMIEKNKKEQEAKDVRLDLEKLENAAKSCRQRALLGATIMGTKCETQLGKLRQLLMVLEAELKEQNQSAVLDALWAIEASALYLQALEQDDDEDKGGAGGGGSKKGDKKKGEKRAPRTPEGALVHEFRKELRSATQSRSDLGAGLAAFQLEKMYDRLPPLSPFLKGWKLDPWQKRVLHHVDQRKSVIVCAPTSSGKTVISTYTCVNSGRVLFVVPTEPLVWQVAAMFQKLLPGSNVAIATNQLAYRPSEDRSKVVVGTPLALESSLVKVRGLIGGEVQNRWDYAQLEGGFDDFDYAVFDEVHALDGEEGAALQRLIRMVSCPMLALSATIGNADQLRDWWQAARADDPNSQNDVVELVEHRGRFINVQNLILDEKGTLQRLHPCAALTASRVVDEGADRVSLALTPADASELYKALFEKYGDAVEHLDPTVWFAERAKAAEAEYVAGLEARVKRKVPGADAALKRAKGGGAATKAAASTRARITLDDSKNLESALKEKLGELAAADAATCDAVLKSFVPEHLSSSSSSSSTTTAFSMLKVAWQMSERKLFPALAFHLDSFRCLGLFKALVAELEAAEKEKYPNWADELRAKADASQRKAEQQAKLQERNAKAAEDEAKDGFDEGETYVDVTAPHPEFVLTSPTSRLSSKEIDDILLEMKKDTGNKETLAASHVLVRALRRGFAIYIDDSAFSVYRRIVQRLAQKGKLAIVFSDASLAYGVNMPFRTVAFCGDEGSMLTPLLAQQMAGRAGRRGLDTQGNLVYLGMDWARIRTLMVGTVPAILGRPPHFPTIAVPLALSPEVSGALALCKHVDRAMLCRLCAASLEEYSAKTKRSAIDSDAKVDECLRTLDVLGLGSNMFGGGGGGASDAPVDATTLLRGDTRPTLCMVWELRNYLPESVALANALPHFLADFVKDKYNFKRADDDADSEAVQIEFMSVLLHIVDRAKCAENAVPLSELSWLKKSPDRVARWDKWEALIVEWQSKLDALNDADAAALKFAVPPGTPLDASVFDVVKDRRLPPASQISSLDRHNLKLRIWNVGNILLKMHNSLQMPGEYITLSPLLRKTFRRITYILSDDINANVDDEDIATTVAKREQAALDDNPPPDAQLVVVEEPATAAA
ncbi:hypothetical protein CTAYLR_004170 [Chrysophaeum taylorii]|uniref:Helicase ATP-binding domain-containing protein n=1 Tax=Chrysophaeum taylorii TaxID=2483200 RepID=A0AAD7UL94_9STRA|nr:hypothetical protein CTAYLR_004170 [Chrysophaeum taylorii]